MTDSSFDSWFGAPRLHSARVSPDGTKVSYVSGQDVMLSELASFEPRRVCAGSRVEWSPDGARLFVQQSAQVRAHDLEGRSDAGSFSGHLQHVDGPHLYLTSPDGHALLRARLDGDEVARVHADEEHRVRWLRAPWWRGYALFAQDESPLVRHLMGVRPQPPYEDLAWVSPQGQLTMDLVDVLADDGLLVSTTMQRAFSSLAVFDPDSRECRFLFEEAWDQRAWRAGDRLLVVDDEAGQHVARLYEWPRLAKTRCDLPADGVLDEVSLDTSGRVAVGVWQSTSCAPRLWVLDLATGATRLLGTALDVDIPSPVRVRFAAEDGEPLWASMLIPEAPRAHAIWLHHGLHGQWRAEWHPLVAALVTAGVAVLGLNGRGSMGFGLPYARATAGRFGVQPMSDVWAAVRYLRDEARATRILCLGQGDSAPLADQAARELSAVEAAVAVTDDERDACERLRVLSWM